MQPAAHARLSSRGSGVSVGGLRRRRRSTPSLNATCATLQRQRTRRELTHLVEGTDVLRPGVRFEVFQHHLFDDQALLRPGNIRGRGRRHGGAHSALAVTPAVGAAVLRRRLLAAARWLRWRGRGGRGERGGESSSYFFKRLCAYVRPLEWYRKYVFLFLDF